jgi:hypothetical protein
MSHLHLFGTNSLDKTDVHMAIDLTLDPVSTTYLDLQNDLNALAFCFTRRYGGEYEENRSEANVGFMISYHEHDPAIAPFVPWCKWKTWKHLQEQHRKIAYRRGITKMEQHEEEFAKDEPRFRLVDFIDELSEDARQVVSLVFDTPKGLVPIIQSKGNEPRNLRSVLRDYLKGIGWSAKQITDSFSEIERALR